MIPGDLLSAFPHRQFHTLPGLLDSWAALPNSNPNACMPMPMQRGSLYHFYDGLWYDPAERRTHDLPCERRTCYRLSQPDTVLTNKVTLTVICVGWLLWIVLTCSVYGFSLGPGPMLNRNQCTVDNESTPVYFSLGRSFHGLVVFLLNIIIFLLIIHVLHSDYRALLLPEPQNTIMKKKNVLGAEKTRSNNVKIIAMNQIKINTRINRTNNNNINNNDNRTSENSTSNRGNKLRYCN